ncbi:PREDICTED: uncharacterized protein LOC107073535 [Polistes dominula]|uniref:Uncharacterized protein LOC107073535 n=1 Tax=Polistes dominula TaxID=743375 RepID=A0ABM1JB69_POLDO|nr:PREDICTED: uncharacterized protein LOC107073535 [Polistes dominula]
MSSSAHLSHLTLLATATAIVVSSTTHSRLDVYGVGGKRTSQTRGIVTLNLQSRYSPLTVTISAHVLKTVTTILPAIKIQQEPEWPHLKGLNLADPEFLIPREVEAPVTLARTTHHGSSQASNSSLQEVLTRFWVQEEPLSSDNSPLTPEEQECELHFKTTYSRDSTHRQDTAQVAPNSPGRFLSDSSSIAPTNSQTTWQRHSLDDSSVGRKPHYYLPHHGVLKPDSSITKFRVVFNSSSASSTGHSLNDITHAGPNLMLNIFDLLIWIRQLKYLFATDITKMYRQIKIHPDDQDL